MGATYHHIEATASGVIDKELYAQHDKSFALNSLLGNWDVRQLKRGEIEWNTKY